RHIDTGSIESHLAHGHIVLLSCLGYSPSGETFNLVSQDVAGTTAAALGADKLVLMHTGPALHTRLADPSPGLSVEAARAVLQNSEAELSPPDRTSLEAAIAACMQGV